MNPEAITLIVVTAAILLVLVELLREVFEDRPTHQPRSHYEDPQFRSPAAWG